MPKVHPSECEFDPNAKRSRGRGPGRYDVVSQSSRRFHPSLYESMRLVTEGDVAASVSYRMTLSGADIITDGHPKIAQLNDFPYVDVVTLNSWFQEMTWSLVNAGVFFVTAHSHATFISSTAQSAWEAGDDEHTLRLLSWAIIGTLVFDYCAQVILALLEARKRMDLYEMTGDVVSQCDLWSADTVKRFARLKTILCLVVMNLLDTPTKVQNAPSHFHMDKAVYTASSLRIGTSRVTCVGYRNGWEYHCVNHEGQVWRLLLAIAAATVLNVLKALTCSYEGSGWGFIFVNVGVPVVLELSMICQAWQRFRVRQKFRGLLESDADGNDAVLRSISRGQLKRFFNVEWRSGEECVDVFAHFTDHKISRLAIATEFDAKCADAAEELQSEHGAKIGLAAKAQLIDPIRTHVKQAFFPCFYEVSTLTCIHVTTFDFPHDLGPFALEPVNIELTAESILSMPDAAGRSTRWSSPLRSFSASCIAQQYATPDHMLKGVLSRLSEVTVAVDERKAAGIPQDAAWFAWSYPVATWGSLPQETRSALRARNSDSAADAFLLWGGFVYFDSSLRVITVLAAKNRRGDGDLDGLLGFRQPVPVEGDGPLSKALAEALATSECGVVSAMQGGDECEGLRCLWLAPQQIQSAKPSHGGFVFYYPSQGDTSTQAITMEAISDIPKEQAIAMKAVSDVGAEPDVECGIEPFVT